MIVFKLKVIGFVYATNAVALNFLFWLGRQPAVEVMPDGSGRLTGRPKQMGGNQETTEGARGSNAVRQ